MPQDAPTKQFTLHNKNKHINNIIVNNKLHINVRSAYRNYQNKGIKFIFTYKSKSHPHTRQTIHTSSVSCPSKNPLHCHGYKNWSHHSLRQLKQSDCCFLLAPIRSFSHSLNSSSSLRRTRNWPSTTYACRGGENIGLI